MSKSGGCFQKLYTYLSELNTDFKQLNEVEDKLANALDCCRLSNPSDLCEIKEPMLQLYLTAFGVIKNAYKFCGEPTGGCLVLEEAKLKRIFNLSYELQSYFIASMTSSCPLKEELYKSGAASALCLSIFGAANSADKLDARASLPLWKLASSVMQQYKSEIRSYDCNQTPLKTEGLFFEQVLRLLLDSVGYFFKECEKSSKEAPPDVNLETSLNTKLKMLNLLTRIITFCIREFVSSSSSADLAPGNSAFIAWMKWMIKYPSLLTRSTRGYAHQAQSPSVTEKRFGPLPVD
ncbi:unnamed protein product [Calicophoron daubneyi]|uniref:Uncharacterized protein n=1 Tax=Calicophoron daubneyi TaxID=300641 RepID=A0AAV2T7Z0_CALDB